MKYQTAYKGRKLTIRPTVEGDYVVTRILGCSVKSQRYFPNASSALKWSKRAIDNNRLSDNDPGKVLGW